VCTGASSFGVDVWRLVCAFDGCRGVIRVMVEALQAKGFLDMKMCTPMSAVISCHACMITLSVVVGHYRTNVTGRSWE